MNPLRRGVLFAAAALLLSIAPRRDAGADVVSPPPDRCPPGHIGVTSHSGPECVLARPTDCAPGWRGVERGECVLALCDGTDTRCEPGDHCVPADVCVVESVRTWSYGAAPRLRGPEIAAPPRYLSDPAHDFHAVDACGEGSKCAVGRCEALRVCLSPRQARPARASRAGHPTGRAFVRTASEIELAKGDGRGDPPGGGSVGPPEGSGEAPARAPRAGGCAGCGTATSSGSALGVAAFVALAAAFGLRRRS
jgi:MYXO-CTERM domain-containing protein